MSERVCENCGKPPKEWATKTLCNACYEYQRRHGKPRPMGLHVQNHGRVCKRCEVRMAWRRLLCKACYEYQRRNGRPRPTYKFADHCLVCGRPKSEATRRAFRAGRCANCHQYWMTHRVERPKEFWDKDRWCDCGNRATHFDIEVPILTAGGYTRMVVFDLCDDCLAYELEPRRW